MKIVKIIMALAFGLAPFFSVGNINPSSINIFENGTVPTTDPFRDTEFSYACNAVPNLRVKSMQECQDAFIETTKSNETAECQGSVTSVSDLSPTTRDVFYQTARLNFGACAYSNHDKRLTLYDYKQTESIYCPHPSYPEKNRELDFDSDGKPDRCYSVKDADLFDSCDISTNDYLSMAPVTHSTVCTTLPDGSMCQYSAVDVGGGHQVYQIDLEASCYEPEPDAEFLDYINDLHPVPDYNYQMGDYRCESDGGLLTCAEIPEDVTDPLTGEAPDGCGTIAGNYACVSGDTDGDSIPDYLDPDIDGDGIKNEDDLDSNGDGQDDVTRPGDNQNNGSGGSVNVDIDLAPVVNELKDINKSISETDVTLNDKPSDGVESFWESEYPDGLQGVLEEKMAEAQTSSFVSFIESFDVEVGSGTATDFNMCFNLGSMGNFGCQQFVIDGRIWGAIRVFILVTASFLCRRIVFGG